MAADTNTGGASGGGPVLAIALGAVVIVVAVVLAMSINAAPAGADKSPDKPAATPGDKPAESAAVTPAGATDKPAELAEKPAAEPTPEKPADKPADGGDKPAAAAEDKPAGDYPPGTVVIGAGSGEELADLDIELPNPVFAGTPKVIPDDVNVDRKRLGKSRGGVVAPKGLSNVALDKKVTSSDDFPIIGDLTLVTDGDKEALDGRMVELAPGKQHVTIDLGKEHEVWAVMVWHNHLDPRVYRDVIVQVSNDAEFKEGVTIVFNNDNDNSSQFGAGKDFEYFESFEGELVNAGGAKGRYVRCWTKGSTADDANHYSEVEVWGREPK